MSLLQKQKAFLFMALWIQAFLIATTVFSYGIALHVEYEMVFMGYMPFIVSCLLAFVLTLNEGFSYRINQKLVVAIGFGLAGLLVIHTIVDNWITAEFDLIGTSILLIVSVLFYWVSLDSYALYRRKKRTLLPS